MRKCIKHFHIPSTLIIISKNSTGDWAATWTSHFSHSKLFLLQRPTDYLWLFMSRYLTFSWTWTKWICQFNEKTNSLLQGMHLALSNRNLSLGKLVSTIDNLRLFWWDEWWFVVLCNERWQPWEGLDNVVDLYFWVNNACC